ncbi:methyl-accepting chemotaxis protein [Paenibacillus sp. TRM 82003]|uniref:methyl-accepting chemotaxis protein n=1 Tax=Kineococcus sp. TRM81007 TaxID=2925831 RepID=UPI001F5A902F|nr:methyl-accepting chemotaxis protein [Kineococcus sp. TRM81007]MCI2238292.1 methyl-accepting chemotaxis protein [Kineococcus sp. TRM81007]MCI3924036.1 methyl-accepting chemotaxis protein [Paenibacillus sp. TRM 82003]
MNANNPHRAKAGAWWADRGIAVKVLAAVALAALVGVLVGVTGLRSLGAVRDSAAHMDEDGFTAIRALDDVAIEFREARIDFLSHVLSTEPAAKADREQQLTADRAAVEEALAAYKSTDQTGREEHVRAFEDAWVAYNELRDAEGVPASRAGDLRRVDEVQEQLGEHTDVMNETLATLRDIENATVDQLAADVEETYTDSRTTVLVLLAVGITVALAAGAAIARSIAAGLGKVQAVADGLKDGDLTRTAGLTSHDEVGRTAQSLDTATAQLRELVGTIDTASAGVAASAQQMSAISTQIAAGAEETSAQAGVVSGAAEEVSSTVQTVAAGSEEMGASIREISSNTDEAARVASEAVQVAESTSRTIAALGESSQEIGSVVKAITAIAEQTNLLALNATIEAARAGEMGKGFAVVAGEVKELAQQTARATDDISRRVQTIQSDAAGAVGAIGEISAIIGRINDFQVTISSAVEEQTATTAEMNRNVAAAAASSGDIATNIAGVADAASSTAQAVTESQQTSADLARTSRELSALVARFRY